MTYLDSGATSLHKPPQVIEAVDRALRRGANSGRGDYDAAMEAAGIIFDARQEAAKLFDCLPEQAAFTFNCTHGLNIAIRTLLPPGGSVVVSGFEHNAVMRPIYDLGAKVTVAGRKLFDWDDTLERFENALRERPDCAVFTHVSNVFGYILPVDRMAQLCREAEVPFVIDCAQSAGALPVSLRRLGADFIAMPGHKGLLGPQGTGILLCARQPKPLILGGTGSQSAIPTMPEELPDRIEAGTLNGPGIAGLGQSLRYLNRVGVQSVFYREHDLMLRCIDGLLALGCRVWSGEHQAATVSFLCEEDCEQTAQELGRNGIAVRAGLHCAPLAHESAGTLNTGTVRISFGWGNTQEDVGRLLAVLAKGGSRMP